MARSNAAVIEPAADFRAESLESKIYIECVKLPFPQLVSVLVEILGKKLTAYIGRASHVRSIEGWVEGKTPYKDAEPRLRAAFQIARLIQSRDFSPGVIQSWFMGMNPELGDRAAATVLREEEIEKAGPETLRAARAFVAGG